MEKYMIKMKRRKYFTIVFIILGLLVCILGGGYYYFYYKEDTFDSEVVVFNDEEDIEEKDIEDINVNTEDLVYVDIKGEVKTPGTYFIESNKRVIDVIKKAGGLTNNADTSATNLSLKVKDEMVIIIYSKEEIKNFKQVAIENNEVINKCNEEQFGQKNDSCIEKDYNNENKNLISINDATIEELSTLPGIGEAKAQKIINHRLQYGRFISIEQLKDVSGIGEILYEQIKNYIRI